MPLPALAGFEKSLADSSGHGVLSSSGRSAQKLFRRALRFTARFSVDYRIVNRPKLAVNPCAPILELPMMPNVSNVPQASAWRQGEREKAMSEVRHAGADERLFVGLPGLVSGICVTRLFK